jgi:putative endopeptidase
MPSILNRRALLIGACTLALAAFALAPQLTQHSATAATAKPGIGAWGVDLAAMDKAVKPGDDFFRHTGGTWMKTTQIPPDRSRWGSFNMLAAKSEDDVRIALEDAAKKKPKGGTAERKAVDYYTSYIDTKAIEARGLDPVKDDLARIAGAGTHEDLIKIVAAPDFRANLPVGMGVTLDQKRPNVYIVSVGQAGLGMPDRDYYLKEDASSPTRARSTAPMSNRC